MISRVTPDVGAGRIMATDGGPHPAELWAQVVVDDLCSLGPNLDPTQHTAALRMKADIMDVLTPIFSKVVNDERAGLAKDLNRITAGVDSAPGVDSALAAVLKASKGTRWEKMFTESMNTIAIKQLLSQHIATLLLGEHSWHADRNPDHEASASFRNLHHPFAPVEMTDEVVSAAKAQNLRNEPGGGV